MKPLLSDKTTAVLDTPDGGKAQLPVTLLSEEEAALLGEIETYLSRVRLQHRLWCRGCGFDTDVDLFVEPHQIAIKCDCRMLFYQGPVPVVIRTHPDEGETLIAPIRVVIPEAPMSVADAYMWRRYDKFLKLHGYREGLWCGQCSDEGSPAGVVGAEISAMRVSIPCNHEHKVFNGLSL